MSFQDRSINVASKKYCGWETGAFKHCQAGDRYRLSILPVVVEIEGALAVRKRG
jgi:hypothetical protein